MTFYLGSGQSEAGPVPGDRGVFGGGRFAIRYNIIDYITISSTGNASDFGDLTEDKGYSSGTSNGTNERGVSGGGLIPASTNVVDYITISSTGNATDFGDLIQERYNLDATSNA